MQFQSIPLSRLVPSPANVRKTNAKDGIEALAANIKELGLLNNLTVRAIDGGKFEVVAGGRRLAALKHLAKTEKQDEDQSQIPCSVIDGDDDAHEISLAENEMRAAMHPADQFEAFKKLADEAHGRDTIAAKFGVTPHVVEQRLKLANVSPKLIKIYREGGMSLEQIMAFSLSTDQRHQEKIWHNLPKYAKEQQRADTVRRAITDKHIPGDNDIAAFIGVEAYVAAGGQVLRDLFSEEDGVDAYFANAALLDKLAGEKLEQIAETVRAEGWKWVAVIPDLSWEEQRKYTQRNTRCSHTDEEKAEATTLRKQIAAIEKENPDEFDRDDAVERQLEELENRLNAAERGTEQWTAKDKELSGAIVTIEDGKALIKRGMMKADDTRAAKKAEGIKTEGASKAKAEAKGLSATLVESLTSQRTVELQRKLIGNPKVALVAALHALIQTVTDGYADSPVQISAEREIPRDEAAAKSEAAKAVGEAVKALKRAAPDDELKLWAWLYKKEPKELLKMLAVCVGASFDAVYMNEPDPKQRDVSDLVADAVKLDMAKHWEPTAAGYFDRVPSPYITAAVTEACGKAEAAKLSGMKKGDMAKAAERLLKGQRWLPGVLQGGKAV